MAEKNNSKKYIQSTEIPTIFKINLNKSVYDQEKPLHNRWHPDVPSVASVD